MVAVTVDAKWRASRIEVWSPYNASPMVNVYCEILLQSTDAETPPVLKGAGQMGMMPAAAPKEGEPTTYGTMPAASVNRPANEETLAETVHVQGIDISLETTLMALNAFIDKWRLEDADKPPVTMMMPPPLPPAPQPTPDAPPPPLNPSGFTTHAPSTAPNAPPPLNIR